MAKAMDIVKETKLVENENKLVEEEKAVVIEKSEVPKTVKEDKVRIFIPVDELQEDKENQFVTVTVNGNTTQIRCGMDVEVSIAVYETLKASGRYRNL